MENDMDINSIVGAIESRRIKITDHADEEAANDDLTLNEIYFSVKHGEIIERYADDKPYPSCLIMGKNRSGDPIHSVWAYNTASSLAALITVYRPDSTRWINWKERVKNEII